jgi:GNAT superfamily N-acetyltransferase
MDTHIRRAVLNDAEVVARILYDSFVEYRHLYTDDGFAATALRPEQIRIRIWEGPLWLASRSEVEGTVSAVAQGDSLYIRGMAVLPSARGCRLGSSLLQQVERWTDGGSSGCSSAQHHSSVPRSICTSGLASSGQRKVQGTSSVRHCLRWRRSTGHFLQDHPTDDRA